MSNTSSSGSFSANSVVDLRKSRVVKLDAGQRRIDARNCRTGVIIPGGIEVSRSVRDLFFNHYRYIRKVVSRFAKPGVAIIAIDEHRNSVAGSACIAAKIGSINTGIVGRHSRTDLYLHNDASLSLRHLAVILDPLRDCSAAADVRYRVVDLRTGIAFTDERGNDVEAITAEGPAFLRCGSYALFCFTTGEDMRWPKDPDDGWACIPERVYLQKRDAEPDRWQREQLPAAYEHTGERDLSLSSGASITLVGTSPGPVAANAELLMPGETPLGRLRIRSRKRKENLIVGATAAERGILLGRYSRCESNARSVLRRDSISRVHMMLLRIDGDLYVVDTASSNGTWLELADSDDGDRWKRIRVMPVADGLTFCLGNERTLVRWTAA